MNLVKIDDLVDQILKILCSSIMSHNPHVVKVCLQALLGYC